MVMAIIFQLYMYNSRGSLLFRMFIKHFFKLFFPPVQNLHPFYTKYVDLKFILFNTLLKILHFPFYFFHLFVGNPTLNHSRWLLISALSTNNKILTLMYQTLSISHQMDRWSCIFLLFWISNYIIYTF